MTSTTSTSKSEGSRILAIVSGKGGSGKTMIAAAIARIACESKHVILIDADTGTAGLSYYLGLNLVDNIAVGLVDIINDDNINSKEEKPLPLRPVNWKAESYTALFPTRFLSVGNHRSLYSKELGLLSQSNSLASLFNDLKRDNDALIIVDCRGGIDLESIEVCRNSDDIILIAEPDTTSFQATQHVVDILSFQGCANKLRGFIINKVFDDPSTVARNGTSVFKCRCLSAVPFDLDATRSFYIGEIPPRASQFSAQIWAALIKAYPEIIQRGPPVRPWTFGEFADAAVTNLDSVRGGLVAAGGLIAILLGVLFRSFTLKVGVIDSLTTLDIYLLSVVIFTFGLFGSLEPTRRVLGRIMSQYVRAITRIASLARNR